MWLGMLIGVHDIPSLMYVSRPPPCLCFLSVVMLAKLFMCGVLLLVLSFVSCIVMISAICDPAGSMPFILIWIILILELGLWVVVMVV